MGLQHVPILRAPAWYNNGSRYLSSVDQGFSLLDNQNLEFGTGQDATIDFDGTNLVIKSDGDLVLDVSGSTQNYAFTDRGNALALQSAHGGGAFDFGLYTQDGDGTDSIFLNIWYLGTPSSIANRERILLGYGSDLARLNIDAAGTGVARDFQIQNDATSWMTFVAGGAVQIPNRSLDLVSQGSIINVGASGNDWTATSWTHSGNMTVTKASSALSVLFYASAGKTQVEISADHDNGNATAVDAAIALRHNGTQKWQFGIDGSETDRFAIATGDVGTNDALRIVQASRAITFDDSSGADFDYVCEGCGRHERETFTCCSLVMWHDDVMALRVMRESGQGMAKMIQMGVYELDGPEDSDPGWLGVNFQNALHFTWSGMWQNRQRMDAQYLEHETHFSTIEERVGALEEAQEILRAQIVALGGTPEA